MGMTSQEVIRALCLQNWPFKIEPCKWDNGYQTGLNSAHS